jgi:penicillin-binding protein 1A
VKALGTRWHDSEGPKSPRQAPRQSLHQPPAKRQRSSFKKTLFSVLLGLFLLLVLGAVLAGCNVAIQAPDVTKIAWNSATVIYDRGGNEVYRLHSGENRTLVKLDTVPKLAVDAFIAVEDPNFYSHHGIDVRGTLRAVVRTASFYLHLPGGRVEGGSTITQQLARDAWLSQTVTVKRKIQEAWVAVELERTYSKDEILEMYLNQIYFGHGAYGIEAAARTFFGKEVGQLTIAEGAQLAGMINGPSYYDPYIHPDDSLQRRNLVLDAMKKETFITDAQYATAKAELPKLGSKQGADKADKSNYFIDYVITLLQDPAHGQEYGLNLSQEDVAKAGLKVYTTMDPTLQQLAQSTVSNQMSAADKQYGLAKDPQAQAAMVSMNPKTGEVLALVGGREYGALLEFNRATDALRQPGSSIKPLVAYTPALEAGLSPATILDDAPVRLTTDKTSVWPENYDFRYQGLKPMRYGVEQSLNPMAIRAMMAAGGPAKGIEYAHKYGLDTIVPADENQALALGGVQNGVRLIDMTGAFGAIANMGVKVDPVIITKIEDSSGQVIFQAAPKKQTVIKSSTAYMMIDMMKDVIRRGTAYGFTGGFKGWPAAGKTGTTEDNRDAWFIGFTPDLVTGVWNGYDIPKNHLKWTGAFVPVQIWNQFMSTAVPKRPVDWTRPADVTTVTICKGTGALPSAACPKDEITTDLFARGTEPTGPNSIYVLARAVQVAVTTGNGNSTRNEWQLWQPGCPGTPVDHVFIKRPEPRVLHPTDPFNPRYVPEDVKNEVPTKMCEVGSWWDRLFPNSPFTPTPGKNGKKNGRGAPDNVTPAPTPGTEPPTTGTVPTTGTEPPVPGTEPPTPIPTPVP